MRGTAVLEACKPKKYGFQELLPLRLRDHVSAKNSQKNELNCLQDMTILFACLKKNEFKEEFCPNEVEAFKKCHASVLTEVAFKKEQDRKNLLIPGEHKLSFRSVNKLLKKFPQPKQTKVNV